MLYLLRELIIDMKKRLIYISMAATFMVCGMWSCKPTEKNYKAAYDAALGKRQQSDLDIPIPGGTLLVDGSPRKVTVNGDSVYISNEKLKSEDGTGYVKHRYNVAVGSYKMLTNCSAHVSDLVNKGYEAFAAESSQGKYYVIAGSFDSLEEAASLAVSFSSREKKAFFVGLPGAPVIFEQ